MLEENPIIFEKQFVNTVFVMSLCVCAHIGVYDSWVTISIKGTMETKKRGRAEKQ